MSNEHQTLDRRAFLTAGAVAAGATVLAREATAAVPSGKFKRDAGGLPTVEFGKTGRTLPVLGHGGSAMVEVFIKDYGMELISREERVKMVRDAYDLGVRYFDSARVYQESEGIMGEALEGVRKDVFLATKVAVFSPQAVRPSVEKSLEELRTDYVDAMQVHGPVWENGGTALGMKLAEELFKMRDEGMIKYVGLTGHTRFENMYEGIKSGGFDQLLIEHGYLPKGMVTQHSQKMREYKEMCLSEARAQGMGIVAMKVMGAYAFGHNAKALVPGFSDEEYAKLPGACIRWVLSDERVDILNIGMSLPSDARMNAEVLKGDLTATDDDRLLLAKYSEKAWETDLVQSHKIV